VSLVTDQFANLRLKDGDLVFIDDQAIDLEQLRLGLDGIAGAQIPHVTLIPLRLTPGMNIRDCVCGMTSEELRRRLDGSDPIRDYDTAATF
jgi:hypothetical protein